MSHAVLDALSQAVPAIALTTAAAIGLAWCVRRLSLEALAYRPGRIEVPVFARGPGVDADAEQLTMIFRERLAVLRLSAPNAVPGSASDGDFLDVLGREKLDTGNVAGSIVTLLRAALPTHAWQVSGLLVTRDTAPSCGVTLQVAQLPRHANPPRTVWADDFEEAVRTAGDYATAAILPRTRLCREPWTAWKHYLLPGELLSAFEQGVRLESERRYDEALDTYYRASAHDPMNMVLRLNIGQLQEKLGLYIDALMTYEGMIEVSRHAPKWRPFAYRRAARSQRRRALVAARYRRIVLLGGASLAEQWRRTGPANVRAWSARDERRFELRARLRRPLGEQLGEVDEIHRAAGASQNADPGEARPLESLRRRGTTPPAQLLEERPAGAPLSARDEEIARFELRELLALRALHEIRELPLRRLRSRDQRVLLTPAAVQLTQMCIEVRLAWIQAQIDPASSVGVAGEWPPRPARLRGADRGHRGPTAVRALARALQRRLRIRAPAARPSSPERGREPGGGRGRPSHPRRLRRSRGRAAGACDVVRRQRLHRRAPRLARQRGPGPRRAARAPSASASSRRCISRPRGRRRPGRATSARSSRPATSATCWRERPAAGSSSGTGAAARSTRTPTST